MLVNILTKGSRHIPYSAPASVGSLDTLLRDPTLHLSWEEPLLKIAQDIARAMVYLHGCQFFDEEEGLTKECIIHRDLKVMPV